jgi:biotin transport system substrate-specific component
MIYASMFGAATAAGAYIIIPLPPVPITLQTLFLALAAVLLGGRLGALSQIIYVLLGVIGLPVFAGGKAGFGVLIGPSGGYLIGFIAGAYVIGKLTEISKRPNAVMLGVYIAIGYLVVYLLGVCQLILIARFTVLKALTLGVVPFLIGDLIKIIAVVIIALNIRDKVKVRP